MLTYGYVYGEYRNYQEAVAMQWLDHAIAYRAHVAAQESAQ